MYDYYDIQKRKLHAMYELQKDITSQIARESISQMPQKETPRNSGIKAGGWPLRFSSELQRNGSNLHSEANL